MEPPRRFRYTPKVVCAPQGVPSIAPAEELSHESCPMGRSIYRPSGGIRIHLHCLFMVRHTPRMGRAS
eukprot:6059605-Pyramimonas_sp.AAC.1